MKAITLTQPWATLVAIGAKRIETRSWKTDYRGPLAIHAAKGFPKAARDICITAPFSRVLGSAGYTRIFDKGWQELWPELKPLPLGAIVATCELIEVFAIHPFQSGFRWNGKERIITHDERAFGDYLPGRYAWILENVQPLLIPIPVKGMLGLWEWEQKTIKENNR